MNVPNASSATPRSCAILLGEPRAGSATIAPENDNDDQDDLARLLDRVRRRDEAAARMLVERIHPIVAKIVASHLPRRDDPEDLYQEIYMKVFSKAGQYRADAPFEHWVARIARTTCFDRLRRQRSRPEWRWSDLSEHEQAVFERRSESDSSNQASAEAARSLIDRILAQLSPEDAWLIRRVDLEEVPFEDVCASMGWSNGGGRVRLFRARRKLKKALTEIERQTE